MVVFDLARPATLACVKQWKQDIDEKIRFPDGKDTPLPCILVANKVSISLTISIFRYVSPSLTSRRIL
jgi:hypothetical protein